MTETCSLPILFQVGVEIGATYAYYFSGTIMPPAVTGTYHFFSLVQSAYLGLRLTGNDETLSYDGPQEAVGHDLVSRPCDLGYRRC